jgi:hypothetical protein
MRSTKIAAYLVTCLLLQACAGQSPPPAAQRAPPAQTAQEVVLATERVTLSDGKTYEVQTGNGLPLPFKNDQIEITGMSPLFSQAGQHKWAFQAQLHEPGDFLVTVTTPIDSSTFTMFDCAGPGEIVETFFESERYPAVWKWFGEPGTSWVPFVFSFREKNSGKEFEVMQWTAFDQQTKASVRRILGQP